jgi:peptidoglycan/LPS O-acetylase OafA/YrhL
MMLDYIQHLDGLRATALLGVLLFHFDVLGATGGFVGVDVFLVLSGFL